MKKIKKTYNGKQKAAISLVLTVTIPIVLYVILFALSPLLLHFEGIENLISYLLSPLRGSNYKSSYIETLGALSGGFLGTFFAIIGAFLTQKKFDDNAIKKEIKESAIIVFYDFDFVIKDFKKIMNEYYIQMERLRENKFKEDLFRKIIKKYPIYIDSDWIHNVAKLSSVLDGKEIGYIYELYGYFTTLKKFFNSNLSDYNDVKEAYDIIMKSIIRFEIPLTQPYKKEVYLREDIGNLMHKLVELGEIEDKDYVSFS